MDQGDAALKVISIAAPFYVLRDDGGSESFEQVSSGDSQEDTT